MKICQKCYHFDPDDVITLNKYTDILSRCGKISEALRIFSRLLKLENDEDSKAKTLARYGTILAQDGQYEKAKENFYKSLELQPNNPETLKTFGNFLTTHGQYQEANQYYEKTLIYSAGSILVTYRSDEKAIEWLKKIRQDSVLYEQAQKMLTLHLDSEEYFNMVNQIINLDAPVGISNTEMLNQAIYHKIANEISILKSIAYTYFNRWGNTKNEQWIQDNLESLEQQYL